MQSRKEVKIIGLEVVKKFGNIRATRLAFDDHNRLTVFKGVVGAGKTTLQTALKLTTQGTNALVDKNLYGDDVHLVTQLTDGEIKVFVECKSNKEGKLQYSLYSVDENGKKIKDVVIDGQKATPASYINSLQTSLTWRLDEFTSQNPTVQRNLLLELFSRELEDVGVVFNKNSPKYEGNIIHQINEAKSKRSYLDSKRKEVGGIATDLREKGIDYEFRIKPINLSEVEKNIVSLRVEIENDKKKPEQAKKTKLNEISLRASDIKSKLMYINQTLIKENTDIQQENEQTKAKNKEIELKITQLKELLSYFNVTDDKVQFITEKMISFEIKDQLPNVLTVNFNDKQQCLSQVEDFPETDKYLEIRDLISEYRKISLDYKSIKESKDEEIDCKEKELELLNLENKLKAQKQHNEEAVAVNAYRDWSDADTAVNELSKDYYKRLTAINTGIEGLEIQPDLMENEKGEKELRSDDIFLTYNGCYDPIYFNNPDLIQRKLSSYSDTQKPMICLLIQSHLLKQKSKCMPYLWIDQVPIDNKTKHLLNKMSEELGLYLFVNWTGDFEQNELKDGEILIENGEVFFNMNSADAENQELL